jgi:recombinational DNA repair protein RecR
MRDKKIDWFDEWCAMNLYDWEQKEYDEIKKKMEKSIHRCRVCSSNVFYYDDVDVCGICVNCKVKQKGE